MHPNTIKRLKKRQILRREDLLEWLATSPLIPGVRETNFPTGNFADGDTILPPRVIIFLKAKVCNSVEL
jgi:hypothetical protein